MKQAIVSDLMVMQNRGTEMWFVGRTVTYPSGRVVCGGVYSRSSFDRRDAEAALADIDARFPNRSDFFEHVTTERALERA